MPRPTPPPGTPPGEKILLPVRPNLVLSALSSDEHERLAPALEPVALDFGSILYQPNGRIERVFFVESGMCSATVTMEDGGTIEVGATGYEGVVGLPLLYGSRISPTTVMVEIAGQALAMPAGEFERELQMRGTLHARVAQCALAHSIQTTQLAACNRLHSVESRLARWLLMTADRVGADRFPLTQQLLAYMLGVHRPSVTVVAGMLQRAGMIDYHRGIITIHDRQQLHASACECYRIIRRAFARAAAPEGMKDGTMENGLPGD